MDQINADEYAVLRANQFVLQIETDARAPGNSRQERGKHKPEVCEACFPLWTAVSLYRSPLVVDLGMIPGYAWCLPRSLVDVCALIVREWSRRTFRPRRRAAMYGFASRYH
jgi:hypothetical protein